MKTMSQVLPSTVEELNCLQNYLEFQSMQPMLIKDTTKDFDNIDAGRFKREFSLPNGVQWNVHDFEPYLNFNSFEDINFNNFEAVKSHEDRLVPGEQRGRSESFSSVSSSMDDKNIVYHNMAIKTFNTVHMDSGSTCISSDHSYIAPSVLKDLEAEETFQNLSQYMTQGTDIHSTDTTTSSVTPANSPPLNESLEYPVLSNFSMVSNNSEDSFSEKSINLKHLSTSPDDLFVNSSKRFCKSPDVSHYHEVRKKNNIASKNCRKTRKEKQKEMDMKLVDLLKENEDLRNQMQHLEMEVERHKKYIENLFNVMKR